tara:strand:- start:62 stop:1024 length:963 start_codon:yes stop_codon:yes gene_type:complete
VNSIKIFHKDGLEFLAAIPDNSVDLILTDPPYITSRETGMDKWVEHVDKQDAEGSSDAKTEEEWKEFHGARDWEKFFDADSTLNKKVQKEFEKNKNVDQKEIREKFISLQMARYKKDYIKYGSIYGKKYAVKTDYGKWDSEFTMEQLELFVNHFYRILRDGGTCIIFFDLWKLSYLKEQLEGAKFKQLRFIEWIKTNPQPVNSGINYLTNCREMALLGVKKGKPTFNSKYDKGIYEYPIYGGKDRFHPTQKSLLLFEELIKKHSNENDIVLDCFLGSGTTALAAKNTNRKFIGCELDQNFFEKSVNRLEGQKEYAKISER